VEEKYLHLITKGKKKMTMTRQSIVATNQQRCSDESCENYDPADVIGNETEEGDGEDNSARPRRPKNKLTPAQVSSVRVSVPVAIEPVATQGILPVVSQKPRIIVKAPLPKIVGKFSGGEANKSNTRGKQ
jgi:hypothetical protein